MPNGFVVGVFLLVIASLGLLVKWEFKRAQRRYPSVSKAVQRHLDEREPAPERAFTAPGERNRRAFEQGSGRR